MKNKTCGDCRFYNSDYNLCLHWRHEDINEHSPICNYFKPLTNGDRIRQGGDYALAHFKSEHRCDVCAYAAPIDTPPACRRPEGKICFDGMLALLNAPADCVKQNGNHDTQTDLCKADNTESDGGGMNNGRFKFRVWDKQKKSLIDNCVIYPDGTFAIFDFRFHEYTNPLSEDDGYVLEQCTGLKDKNGKLIYEGDVLQAPGRTIAYKVQWAQHGFVVKAGFSSAKSYPMSNCDMFEIIGTIHDDQFRDAAKLVYGEKE